jgi:hypothetical protein
MAAIGVQIFIRILTKCPHLRHVFSIPDDVATVQLCDYTPFHRFARNFVTVIDLCVRHVYNMEADVGAVLKMYGRRHHQMAPGMLNEHMPVFVECMVLYIGQAVAELDAITIDVDECMQAWHTLFAFIAMKTLEGEQHEAIDNKRSNDTNKKWFK